jgi:hypothetical protein
MPKGEVGSIPTPATKLGYQLGLSSGSGRLCKSTPARFDSSATHQDSFRGQHKGAGDPCKIAVRGALPRVSTRLFPSSHLGEGGRLLTGEAWFEATDGSHLRDVRLARVPAKWAPVRRQGHAPTLESSAGLGVLSAGTSVQIRYVAPASRSSTGRAPRYERGGMQVRILPGRPFHQGVGELACPRLPWKQETGGWNPPALTNRARFVEACPRILDSGVAASSPIRTCANLQRLGPAERTPGSEPGDSGSIPGGAANLVRRNSP